MLEATFLERRNDGIDARGGYKFTEIQGMQNSQARNQEGKSFRGGEEKKEASRDRGPQKEVLGYRQRTAFCASTLVKSGKTNR